jgi:hypothetical protein
MPLQPIAARRADLAMMIDLSIASRLARTALRDFHEGFRRKFGI